MKLTLGGLILIAFGVVVLIFKGIPYKTEEKILEVGPFHATSVQDKTIVIPPEVGAGIVGAGALLLIIGARRKK